MCQFFLDPFGLFFLVLVCAFFASFGFLLRVLGISPSFSSRSSSVMKSPFLKELSAVFILSINSGSAMTSSVSCQLSNSSADIITAFGVPFSVRV